jgi:hypothetical protein
MRNIAREVDIGACGRRKGLCANEKGDVTFQNVERLIFRVVYMERRRKSGGGDLLNEREHALRGFGRSFEYHQRAQEPEGLPFFACQPMN